MGETNSPSVTHVGYDISPLSRVKFNSLEWRNIVTHGQLKENLYLYMYVVRSTTVQFRCCNIHNICSYRSRDISLSGDVVIKSKRICCLYFFIAGELIFLALLLHIVSRIYAGVSTVCKGCTFKYLCLCFLNVA